MADFDETDLMDIRRYAGYGQPIEGVALTPNAQALEDRLAAMSDDTAEHLVLSFVTPIRDQYARLAKAKLHLSGMDDIKYSPDELKNRLLYINTLGAQLAKQIGVPVGPGIRSGGRAVATQVTR